MCKAERKERWDGGKERKDAFEIGRQLCLPHTSLVALSSLSLVRPRVVAIFICLPLLLTFAVIHQWQDTQRSISCSVLLMLLLRHFLLPPAFSWCYHPPLPSFPIWRPTMAETKCSISGAFNSSIRQLLETLLLHYLVQRKGASTSFKVYWSELLIIRHARVQITRLDFSLLVHTANQGTDRRRCSKWRLTDKSN